MSWLSVIPRTLVALFVAACLLVTPAVAADPTVELLAPGMGDRIVLRSQPKVGTSETMEMLMKMDMVMDMGGMGRMPQTVPPIAMVMTAKVEKVNKDEITYSFELADTKVIAEGADPLLIAALEPELQKMVGTTGKVVVSSTGITRSTEITPPEGANPEQFANMQKSMNHASAPFPAEAVGVGGKWQVTQEVTENGLTVVQVVTYTVKSIEGDTVTLETALVQNAGNDEVKAPGMPPGASAKLEAFDSTGTGETVVSLSHLFPTRGKLDHDMKTRMTIQAEGQTVSMGMEIGLGLELSRK